MQAFTLKLGMFVAPTRWRLSDGCHGHSICVHIITIEIEIVKIKHVPLASIGHIDVRLLVIEMYYHNIII